MAAVGAVVTAPPLLDVVGCIAVVFVAVVKKICGCSVAVVQ